MQRDTLEDGFEGFEMRYWINLETPLEQEILERLQEKLVHVKDFRLTGMDHNPKPVNDQLLEFGAIVIEQH